MHTTHLSLIQRLASRDGTAWETANQLYRPMILRWLSRRINVANVEDVAQEVMLVMSQKIDSFEHNGRIGAFRNWLRTITIFVMRNFCRKSKLDEQVRLEFENIANQLEDPGDPLCRQFNREHDLFVLERAINQIGIDFKPESLESFRRYCLAGEAPKKISADLNLTVNAIYIAKFRIIKRLKSVIGDLDELGVG